MRINVLNEKMNVDPDRIIEVTKTEFFDYYFRMILLKDRKTLSDNEIKIMSVLCADKEMSASGISKNNLSSVVKKLNEKGFLIGSLLSETSKLYKKMLTKNVEMVFNFKIVDDDTG